MNIQEHAISGSGRSPSLCHNYERRWNGAGTALKPAGRIRSGEHDGLLTATPAGWFAAILGFSALLALVALSVPTRRALRTRPAEAIRIRE